MQGKYDAYIRHFSSRELGKLDPAILDILRLGFHEIISMRTPEHAAVSQTVDLARFVVGASTGSFVNAVLRSALRDESNFHNSILENSDPISRLCIEYSHPEWIVRAFFDLTKDWNRVESILICDNEAASPHLIAWPGRASTEELLHEGGSLLEGTKNGVLSHQPPGSYAAIRERRAGVQDRGSQAVGEAFLATARDIPLETTLSWLDMCAGPGGKAALLYHALKTERQHDFFQANEISEHRAALVAQVIPSEHVSNTSGQSLALSAQSNRSYDRIIVDAPCTGLGALRRRPESRWRRTVQDLKELVVIQRELLDSAVMLLKSNGVLAYVTCSPHLAETRLQIADFLHRHPEFEVMNIRPYISPVFDNGVLPDGTLQLWTDMHDSDSMFMALLHRKNSSGDRLFP
jgi:16S rRNA (cytosine967-C5)-methyltransferase